MESGFCQGCGNELSYIARHGKWWCDRCQSYVDGPPPEPPGKERSQSADHESRSTRSNRQSQVHWLSALAIVALSAVAFTTYFSKREGGCSSSDATTTTGSESSAATSRKTLVIDSIERIRDNHLRDWQLPPGRYRTEFNADSDGASIKWIGKHNCKNGGETKHYEAICEVFETTVLRLANPSTLGLGGGRTVTVSIQVRRLP